jgi:glutamate-1-semialdehyde 2,1-aminomutase
MSVIEDVTQLSQSTACEALLERARRTIAGGDSSTMRVLPYHLPLVAERGDGCRVWDADGREYLDLNMAYGPLIFGHCPRPILEAVCRQITERGSQLGFPTEISIRTAENVKQLFPGMELLRFANSGTEANASAIRLARAYSGKKKLVVFEGHYHGWSEGVFNRYHAQLDELPAKGYGPAIPGTVGMSSALDDVIVCRWNNLDVLEACLKEHAGQVAAVLMEPVMGNGGTIAPRPGYLQGVREMTLDQDVLLMFDEVITGMRVAAGGAQEHYLVQPDITIISKVLGAGYPVAAFGAPREIMDLIVQRKVFHGGVFSANAAVMAAAEAATGRILALRDTLYPALYGVADQLAGGFDEILTRLGVPHLVQYVGPMISLFLTKDSVSELAEYRDVRRSCEFEKYIELQHAMQRAGVYYHPNQFEPMFLSSEHKPQDIETVLDRFEQAARSVFGD